jgi:acetyltransferase-like isoleucine patch superfamily enzyme
MGNKMIRRVKMNLATLFCLMPASSTKNRLLRAIGHEIDLTARFNICLVRGVGKIHLGKRAVIGPGNVFRDLRLLSVGPDSVIGQWNWVSAAAPLVEAGGAGSLEIGTHSALTSRHYVDASGGVQIGDFTTVAGVRSTFITHGIDWMASEQRTRPITIGSYCLIGSNSAIVPGTIVVDNVVTGMGATLGGNVSSRNSLYVGERAKLLRTGQHGQYFTRPFGFVSPASRNRGSDPSTDS